MYNHNKAQQSKNRVHISWDILYVVVLMNRSSIECVRKIYDNVYRVLLTYNTDIKYKVHVPSPTFDIHY